MKKLRRSNTRVCTRTWNRRSNRSYWGSQWHRCTEPRTSISRGTRDSPGSSWRSYWGDRGTYRRASRSCCWSITSRNRRCWDNSWSCQRRWSRSWSCRRICRESCRERRCRKLYTCWCCYRGTVRIIPRKSYRNICRFRFWRSTIGNIGDDMTQDQKEKAQEVVVPVILTRIASMAAFVFRRSLW